MTTALASPTYALDGWTGNAVNDDGVTYIVEDATGWSDGAPIRLATSDVEGADGGRSGPPLLGPRLIVLKGVATAPDRATMLAAKDKLAALALGTREAYPLVVTEAHLTRRAMVKPFAETKARDEGSRRFRWEIALRADDPLRYSVDPVTVSASLPPDTLSGLEFPLTFPLEFGDPGLNSDTGVFCVNAGNTDVLPVVTIYGPVVNPVVQNVSVDRLTAFDLTLAADQWLVVDHAAHTVLLNGSANRRGQLMPQSTWWPIAPGSNEIRFRANAYTAATASITYRSAWK